jgi:lysophospholipase L1-like esterase
MRSVFLAFLFFCAAGLRAQDPFALKEGDRVVFFGDSITDQRLYTTFVETFAVTRFPSRNITFVHSGWGGDRVTGGGGGGIRQRLERDVIAYKPSVVTIMLGMNDGRYRAFDQQIFDIYSSGYRSIIKDLKEKQPGVRITAIQPSPFDDVTRAPRFNGGYNAVLLRYGQFIAELAAKEGLTVADLNTPVTAMLAKAKALDAQNAEKIVPDRVHPAASGHLIMAASLLKSWNAPAIVSEVEIDASAKRVSKSENTTVSKPVFRQTIKWTQTDKALPVPVDMADAVMALAVKSSDFQETLNRQTMRVKGLTAPRYTLYIDGDEIGTFTSTELADGVNLSGMKTPMWAQAWEVHSLTLKRAAMHQTRWRNVQVPMEVAGPQSLDAAMSALDAVSAELGRKQRAAAVPKAHQFELAAGDSSFKPVFNGTDLSGWHISQTNHHGVTQAWKVEQGTITGTQDKPGHGGILLTDRKYRSFEVQMEIRPDYSCDSGLFLRSSEEGEAYQVMLDYLDGGAIGGIYGEKLQGVKGSRTNWRDAWKSGDWNHLRARMEGDVPHIQVWLNGVKITDWRDTANHAAGGAIDGMVAVQVHGGNRWIPGGKHRFRNIAIRELD